MNPPTGNYTYICEHIEPDGSLHYPQEGLTMPGPEEKMFRGLQAGQCPCCYYRKREILEWTTSGPGCLALMTPGWYQDEGGYWKWWHADPPHGQPGWSCRDSWQEENLKSLEPNMEALADADVEAQQDPESSEPPQDHQVNLDQSESLLAESTSIPGTHQNENQNSHENRDSGPEESSH